ncbi:MAG: divalent-cation tolerance protein CutA [Methanoregula sp.]|nr:MAG: divalent-cation tolerance protein CutA [Methanoregula sp.]
MSPSPEIVMILSTVPQEKSEEMARALLDKRLVACINTLPVRSFYHWKGEFCDDLEQLLILKTTRKKVKKVITAIREMHPYEIPEIIAIPVIAGHTPYLDWVYEETRG